jgi:hypothetical protein
MRRLTAAVAVAAIGILVAACDSGKGSSPAPTSTTTTTSTRPPVAQAALANFLLTPTEIDSLLGVTGTTSKEKISKPQDDDTKQHWPQGWKFPPECLYGLGPAEGPVVADSGFTAVVGDDDQASNPPDSKDMPPEVTQVLVLFPSANEANAFFTTSSQRWPACANRQFTTPGDADNPEVAWKMGPVSTANATLTATLSMSMTMNGTSIAIGCQRALTVRNNVAIDVAACRNDAGDLGVKVASQIAGKVDK